VTRSVPGRTDHVVVVGAGFAGLTTALHLLGAGREVTVVERADHPGGRAGLLDLPTERGTFRVDTGPTVLTMPGLLDEAFAAVGEKLAERLDLVELDPAYRTHFADGSTIDVHTDGAAMEEEVRRACGPVAAAGYVRMRAWLTALY
jgi:phytoene desaturase